MRFFSTSLQALQWQIVLWPSTWDRVTETVLDLFVTGKFLAIFAFLFGYGMVLFRDRAWAKGRRFSPVYCRRLLVLAAFGLLHGWFIWFGDILFHYALLGGALLLFRNSRSNTDLAIAIILLLLVPLLLLISGAAASVPELTPEFEASVRRWIARDQAVYGNGSYVEVLPQRFMDWRISAFNHLVFYPQILAMFLFGTYFAKRGLLHDPSAHRVTLVNIAWLTAAIGVPLTFGTPLLRKMAGGGWMALVNQLDVFRQLVGAPVLGLFYITMLTFWLTRRPRMQTVLSPIANVGRMAFTNYIVQSVICTLIFYGYGLGWYGKVGPASNALLALLIFVLQTAFSNWWFGRFRIGPLEWVWRVLTYGRIGTA